MKKDITRKDVKQKYVTVGFQGVPLKHINMHKGVLGQLQKKQGEAGRGVLVVNGKR